jgi:hypothetical protein
MEVTLISLQVVESDESESPGPDRKRGGYLGRHRGADRLRQLTRAGGVLAAVVALLAGGGALLFWITGGDDPEPLIEAGRVGELCDLVVDEELLAVWAASEQGRESTSSTEDEIRVFNCLYSAEHNGDDVYRLVTVYTTLQVYDSAANARQAHAGALEFEESLGNTHAPMDGLGERGALVVLERGDERELRLHVQTSNATIAVNLFLTGAPPEDTDDQRLIRELAAGLTGALPRDG